MFWDKKDEKKMITDLPPLKLPERQMQNSNYEEDEENEEYSEKHGLPSFPDSPQERGFSQAAIKEAINNNDMEESNSEYENINTGPPKTIRTIEMKEWEPDYKLQDPSKDPLIEKMRSFSQKQKGSEVFIKLQKFTTAKKALIDVESKIDELEKMLKKIREVKMREEQELSAWEREISTIKARIETISENLLDKS